VDQGGTICLSELHEAFKDVSIERSTINRDIRNIVMKELSPLSYYKIDRDG